MFKRSFAVLLAILLVLGCLPAPAAAVSFYEMLEVACDGDALALNQTLTEVVTIDKNLILDLNGYHITGALTVTPGNTLYVMDSMTDDYTVEDGEGYGKITAFSGAVEPCSGYMKVTEEDGVSFHRLDMAVTSMTLRTECVGVYYNGSFYADEVAAQQVKGYGIALRIKQAPDAQYMMTTSAYSIYEDFVAGGWGNVATGTLLKNVMSTSNTNSVNDQQSKLKIWGCPYVLTKDGQYLFGESVSRSLLDQAQAVDAIWKTLTTAQKNAFKTMYRTYSTVMENWYLPNVNNTDIDVPI